LELSARYGEQLHIRVIDPQSLEGLFRSLRHWISRYPTFIIDRKKTYTGWDPGVLDRLLVEQRASGLAGDQAPQKGMPWWVNLGENLGHILHIAREMLYGMTTFDWARGVRRERAEVERLFVLVTFGELIGLPILPPYYTLRLVPYVVPQLNRWKRSLLRERDWTDLTDLIEGVD
jgi:hypothetical protein